MLALCGSWAPAEVVPLQAGVMYGCAALLVGLALEIWPQNGAEPTLQRFPHSHPVPQLRVVYPAAFKPLESTGHFSFDSPHPNSGRVIFLLSYISQHTFKLRVS